MGDVVLPGSLSSLIPRIPFTYPYRMYALWTSARIIYTNGPKLLKTHKQNENPRQFEKWLYCCLSDFVFFMAINLNALVLNLNLSNCTPSQFGHPSQFSYCGSPSTGRKPGLSLFYSIEWGCELPLHLTLWAKVFYLKFGIRRQGKTPWIY